MKKKQKKSRNAPKKRPLPKRTINPAKGLNNKPAMNNDSTTYKILNTMTMMDIKETDGYSSESGEFIFRTDKPILEFRSGGNVTTEPMINLMQPAWELASIFLKDEIKGEKATRVSFLEDYPNLNFPLHLLTKLVLTEKEDDIWGLEINYVELEGEEKSIYCDLPIVTELNSRKNMEGFLINVLAGLIIESGKDFPEFGIQARSFLIDNFLLVIPAAILSGIRTNTDTKELWENFHLEEADLAFKDMRVRCGGKITEKAFFALDVNDAYTFTVYAMVANMHGQRCWPFKNSAKMIDGQ